jgi:hypothetical protein
MDAVEFILIQLIFFFVIGIIANRGINLSKAFVPVRIAQSV